MEKTGFPDSQIGNFFNHVGGGRSASATVQADSVPHTFAFRKRPSRGSTGPLPSQFLPKNKTSQNFEVLTNNNQPNHLSAQLHPVVAPHVSHFKHVPLRTRVKFAHSGHASPI